jgi:hypothetical protein
MSIAALKRGCEALNRIPRSPLGDVGVSFLEQATMPTAMMRRRTRRSFEECFIRTSCAGGERWI